MLDSIVELLTNDIFDIILLTILIIYREKLIFKPLAGGNGVVQMDELSRGIILLVFYVSARAEMKRVHEWSTFSDAYWYALIGGVFLIAGLKDGLSLLTKKKEDEKH